MIWTDTSKAEIDNLSKGYTYMDNTTINPKTCTWDWKSFFQRSTLELGQKDENTGKLIDFYDSFTTLGAGRQAAP